MQPGNLALKPERHSGNQFAIRRKSYGRVLYNRSRYYDPRIGRYISADPIGQYSDINLYRYGFSNPIGQIDPFGLGAPGSGFQGHGLSFGNPTDGPRRPDTRTDAERAVQQFSAGAVAGGAGLTALTSSVVTGNGVIGLAGIGLGLAGAILSADARLTTPDGDNDNDGIPDFIDPDWDNDGIPNEIDPDPLIGCDFFGGACETPAAAPISCEGEVGP